MLTKPVIEFLTIRTEKGIESFDYSEIIFVEADRKYTKIYLVGQENPRRVLISLSTLEKNLHPDSFFKTHRSYIINLKHRRTLEKGGNLKCINGHCVPIAVRRIKEYLLLSKLVCMKLV